MKSLSIRIAKSVIGLFIFSFGSYVRIPANIGLNPWTAFTIGIADTFNLSFGTVSISTSIVILLIDWLLKEKLGIATILDALLVGIFTDFFLWLDFIPKVNVFWIGTILLLIGQVFISVGVYYYMSPALGCGPRDSLMIAISKRSKSFPVGLARGIIEGSALLIGWIFGAKVGIGTVISVFGISILIQLTFKFFKFDANAVEHQNITQSIRTVFND